MQRNRFTAWGLALVVLTGWWLPAGSRLGAADKPPLIEDDDEPLPGGQPAVKPPTKQPNIVKGMTIACLGDDWTAPNPNEKMGAKSFPIALQMLLDAKYGANYVKVVAAGQAGACITDYDKIYSAQIEKLKPDIVIVQDCDQPISGTGFKIQLQKLVDRMKANKTAEDKVPKIFLLETFHDMEFTGMNRDKIEEFHKARDWTANNQILQITAQEKKCTYVETRKVLGNGYSVMKDLNYTHPFRADGVVPSYIGATLIAMKLLDLWGENLDNYNYRAWEFPEDVRKAMVGVVHNQQFVNGKIMEETQAGPKIAPELESFDKAVRVEQRVVVAYFGGDEMGKASWIGQNANFMKTYYGPKIETLNASRPGDTSKTGLQRMEVDVLKYKPSLLLVAFGFSDARDKAGISTDDSRANLLAMIEKTRKLAPDCTLVLVTAHSLNSWGEGDQRRSDLAAYYKVIREVAKEQKLALIDNSLQWDDWAANNPDKYNELIGTALIPGPAGQLELSKKAEEFFRNGCPRAEKK